MLYVFCLILFNTVIFIAAQWFCKSLSAITVTVDIIFIFIFNFNPVLPNTPKIPNFKRCPINNTIPDAWITRNVTLADDAVG